MIGKRFRSLPFIFANDNYTLSDRKKKLSVAICKQLWYNKGQSSN